MTGRENFEVLEKFVQRLNSGDIEALSELLHEDYVEEYPQSGERIKGKENWRKVYENFPDLPEVKAYNIHAAGYLGVVEILLEYPDGTYNGCEIVEFEDGKIVRSRSYFGTPFEAPDWRSEWVEMMGESTTDQGYDEEPSTRV